MTHVSTGTDFICPNAKETSKEMKRSFLYQEMDEDTRKDLEEMEQKASTKGYIFFHRLLVDPIP